MQKHDKYTHYKVLLSAKKMILGFKIRLVDLPVLSSVMLRNKRSVKKISIKYRKASKFCI